MKTAVITNIKKLISILLCTILISSTIPTNVLGGNNKNDIKESLQVSNSATVKTFEEFHNAMLSPNVNIILLDNDITIPNNTCFSILGQDKTITSHSGKKTIKLDESPNSSIINKPGILCISENSTVNFKNITINLSCTARKLSLPIIELSNNSTLNINSGTTIENLNSDNSLILADNSKLKLDTNSSIRNCNSNKGTICLKNNSKLNMNGGCIDTCSAINGGAIYAHKSTIEVNGGKISNCTAQKNGNAIYLDQSKLKFANNNKCEINIPSKTKGIDNGLGKYKYHGIYDTTIKNTDIPKLKLTQNNDNNEITFTKPATEDKILDIKSELKNCTITKIVNTNKGNQILKRNKDYKITSDKIILKKEYLSTLPNGTHYLEIYFSSKNNKSLVNKDKVKLHIAKFENLYSQYTISDQIYEAHKGYHADPAIYDPRKIRLNCGDKIQDEITYNSSNPIVATIDKKTGDLKIKNPGEFKIIATRKFKKPKDKNYTTLKFESGVIPVLTDDEFINGISKDKKKWNNFADRLKSDDKSKNIKEIVNGLKTKKKANLLKNILIENEEKINKILIANLHKWNQKAEEIKHKAVKNRISKWLENKYKISNAKGKWNNFANELKSDDKSKNIKEIVNGLKTKKKANLLKNILIENEEKINKILIANLHKWNQKAEEIKHKAVKNRISKWLENKYKISNAKGKWNNFANELKSDDKSKNIKEIVNGLKTKRKATLLRNILDTNEKKRNTILTTILHKWTNNVKKLELDENARKIQHAYRNFRKKENQANAVAMLYKVLGRYSKQYVLNALKENYKKSNNNIYNNPIEDNSIISDLASMNINGSKQLKSSTNTAVNNIKSSYNNESNETDKIIFRSAKPITKDTQVRPKMPVTIENVKIKNKIFDGTNQAEFDGTPTLKGINDGDEVRLKNATPTFSKINVGENIPINFTDFSLEGKDAYKYYIKQQPNNVYANIISKSNYRNSHRILNSNCFQLNNFSDSNNIKINELKLSNFSRPIKNKLTSITLPNDTQLNIKDNLNSSDISNSDNASINDPDEIFEAEDDATGIQVYAPKGVFPKCSKLVVKEMQQNTDNYDDIYKNLNDDEKNKIENIKLCELCILNQSDEMINPNISKGLIRVRIPIPNDNDLANLQIDRIKQFSHDDFSTNIVTINNKNYYEFQTNNFSPYTIIDEKIINAIPQSNLSYILSFLIIIVIGLSILTLTKRKTIKVKK